MPNMDYCAPDISGVALRVKAVVVSYHEEDFSSFLPGCTCLLVLGLWSRARTSSRDPSPWQVNETGRFYPRLCGCMYVGMYVAAGFRGHLSVGGLQRSLFAADGSTRRVKLSSKWGQRPDTGQEPDRDDCIR